MTLPQTNAELTNVDGGSSTDDGFEGPAGRGANKWNGSASAYLRERRDRRQTAEGDDRVLDRVLIVENSEPAVDWQSGDFVDFVHGGDAQTGVVKLVERRDVSDPDIPPEFQTTRLTLEIR